jgi:hypothetical protein
VRHQSFVAGTAVLWLALSAAVFAQEPPSPAPPSITRLRGDVYQVQSGAAATMFVVTDEGIVLADPLDRATAEWLRAELDTQFPDRPVKYVILGQHRFDRAEGASRFGSAAIIAQQNFNRELSRSRDRIPAYLADVDRDGSGRIEATELGSDAQAARLRSHDSNGDGDVTANELHAYVTTVQQVFASSTAVTLGGRKVEIVHPGPAYAAESALVYVPGERVAFVSAAPVLTGPLSFGSARPIDVLTWVRTITALDFDLLLTGRGETVDRADLVVLRQYLDDLVRVVMAGYESGRPLADVQAGTLLESHRQTPHYGQRLEHIADVYRRIQVQRISVYATAGVSFSSKNADYCAAFDVCDADSAILGQTTGLSYSRRRLVVAAEVTLQRQAQMSRSSALYDDGVSRRETTVSVFGGYASAAQRAIAFNLLGGVSFINLDAAGIAREKQSFAPGRRTISERTSRIGLTGGADVVLSLASRWQVMVPVRVTRAQAANTSLASDPWSVSAGIGLRYRLQQRVH